MKVSLWFDPRTGRAGIRDGDDYPSACLGVTMDKNDMGHTDMRVMRIILSLIQLHSDVDGQNCLSRLLTLFCALLVPSPK